MSTYKARRGEGKIQNTEDRRQEEIGVSGDQGGGDQENRGSPDSLLMIDYLLLIRARVGLLDGCLEGECKNQSAKCKIAESRGCWDGCFWCFYPPCSVLCPSTDRILFSLVGIILYLKLDVK